MSDTFNATLIIKDFNISDWTANNSGLWLGLGYGSDMIENSDVTICSFNFTNSTTDTFICQDGKYENGAFNFDENQNVTDVRTILAQFNFETNTSNFEVGFMRPFITNENQTGQDTNLTATQMNIVWAYGSNENGIISNPLPENSGAVILDLTLMPVPQPQPTEEPSTTPATTPATTPVTTPVTTPTTPAEVEKDRGVIAGNREPLRGTSSAQSLSAIFSVLFLIGAFLHLA